VYDFQSSVNVFNYVIIRLYNQLTTSDDCSKIASEVFLGLEKTSEED
jgi:hypothetical protein